MKIETTSPLFIWKPFLKVMIKNVKEYLINFEVYAYNIQEKKLH